MKKFSFITLRPYLFLFLASAFWSSNMVVARGVRESIPPVMISLARWVVAFIVLLPWAYPSLPSQWPAIKEKWHILLLLGLLGVGFYNTIAYFALQYTSATNVAVINSLSPIATLLLAVLFFKHQIDFRQLLGTIISLFGVIIIVAQGRWEVLAELQVNQGDILMLVAVFSWGFYTVFLPYRPSDIDPKVQLLVFITVGIVFLIPFAIVEYALGHRVQWNFVSITSMIYIGIFPGLLGLVCYNAGVEVVGPSIGSLFLHLVPIIVPILAFFFLGEQLIWYHAFGIAAILFGIFLVTLSSIKRQAQRAHFVSKRETATSP